MALFGDDTEEWIGEPVVLFKDRATYRGDVFDTVRLRGARKSDLKNKVTPASAAPTDDEIPLGEPPTDVSDDERPF